MNITNRYFHEKSYNKLEITLVFFRDCVIFTFRNDVVAEFIESLLKKSLGEVYTYDFIDSVDINQDETNYISQEFLQSQKPSRLPLF